MKRYGVRWTTYIAGLHHNSNCYSKPEKELCDRLFEFFGDESKFYSNNGQLKIGKMNFDFAYRNKIIEFNGDFWHANPSKYSADFINPVNKKTSKEVWERDKLKNEKAKELGYAVKIIWESDYKKNKEKIIKECIEWILS